MSFGVTTGKTATTVIQTGSFFPDLAVAEFLEIYRIPAEYAEALTADHLETAFMWAVKRTGKWVAERQGEGFANMREYPFLGIMGGAEKLFKRGVFCYAKALLLQQFPSIERRDAAKNDAKDAPETSEQFFAAAKKALAQLVGDTFVNVGAV